MSDLFATGNCERFPLHLRWLLLGQRTIRNCWLMANKYDINPLHFRHTHTHARACSETYVSFDWRSDEWQQTAAQTRPCLRAKQITQVLLIWIYAVPNRDHQRFAINKIDACKQKINSFWQPIDWIELFDAIVVVCGSISTRCRLSCLHYPKRNG